MHTKKTIGHFCLLEKISFKISRYAYSYYRWNDAVECYVEYWMLFDVQFIFKKSI